MCIYIMRTKITFLYEAYIDELKLFPPIIQIENPLKGMSSWEKHKLKKQKLCIIFYLIKKYLIRLRKQL